MDKKKIKKAIESLKKRKKEHEEKLKTYDGKNYALKEYWEKEIERFDNKIDEFEIKLNE